MSTPQPDTEKAYQNTDRELWREREGDYYADSIHVTEQGGIGINCGGTVYVKTLREWHALASAPQPDTETLVETVKAGAHFYMAHRMTEFPHPSAPEITMAQHVPGDEDCPGCAAEAALEALRARLAETEAQRDDALRALIVEVRRVAALEAALREIELTASGEADVDLVAFVRAALDALPSQPAQPDKKEARSEDYLRFVEAVPWQPAAPSLTAEDAAYVARRATWERK